MSGTMTSPCFQVASDFPSSAVVSPSADLHSVEDFSVPSDLKVDEAV